MGADIYMLLLGVAIFSSASGALLVVILSYCRGQRIGTRANFALHKSDSCTIQLLSTSDAKGRDVA